MMRHSFASLFAATLAIATFAGPAFGQSCPSASTTTSFASTGLSNDCATNATPCTTKSGTQYDSSNNKLILPGSAGNFQGPPGAAVQANVFFAAPGDFDKDGWTDFIAADDRDNVYIMRNQTLTCGKSSCTGSSSVAPVRCDVAGGACSASNALATTDAWWNTLGNKRPAAFRTLTTTGGTALPLKSGVSSSSHTPMAAGDFNGDGWPDFVQFSLTHQINSVGWANAARLFLNTQNCHASGSFTPCGIGSICTAQSQPANGACNAPLVKGTPWAETNLSCTATDKCPYYMPTFATYDLQTGNAISTANNTTNVPTSGSSTAGKPGDFGPMGHAAQNIVVLDWDGDGDLDFLYSHSPGTCPGSLCTTSSYKFYTAIDVWKNDCAQSAQWNATSKSCIGHIPKFSKSMAACNDLTCANADVLIPSTAHNTTTIRPDAQLGFDVGGTTDRRIPAFAYTDIDKDGDYDLVVGSPGCCNSASNAPYMLRVYRGTSNSKSVHTLDTANPILLSTTSSTYKGFEGSLTAVFVHDFSGDGWPDIITGSDGVAYSGLIGGITRYWKNTANATDPFGKNWPSCATTQSSCTTCSSTCNPGSTLQLSQSCGTSGCSANLTTSPPKFGDYDMGLMLDYDHDPQNTVDMVFTNGNTANEFYIFPNRASPATTAACGTAVSGVLDTPPSELTVSGACIAPNSTAPSGTAIQYFLSNDNGTTWSLACTQTSSGYSPALTGGQCCVTFSTITNRQIMWKAEMDSNTSDGIGPPNGCTSLGAASTPSIASVGASYTYTASTQHYKAGVVVSDGVSYVGSFTQPGSRGHLYMISADFGTQYADVGAKLDAQSSRNVYTASTLGTAPTQLAFTTANATNAALQARIGTSDPTEAQNVIAWMLSARFGLAGSGTAFTKLGAIQNSTPAILQKPFRPSWYVYLPTVDKSRYDAFSTAQSTRIPLAIFASMDGFIHAIYAIATSISDPRNGKEAWAFLPPYVAASATSDYDASVAAGSRVTTVYPDGSPTLVDFKRTDNQIRTAAIVGDGAGGTSITALDVTQTVTETSSTTNTTSGPTPLWSAQPGTSTAGYATSKPAVARVKIGGVEKFLVIAGTGVNASDASKGKIVSAYNLEDGTLYWQFETSCPLTSDITVFETDDSGEPGSPSIDGYADRAVFADSCGYVYKLNPAQDLSGAYMGNSGYGSIALGTSNGVARYALFSTTQAGAIGTQSGDDGQRPITNTIGARTDSSSNMVLFFGTGGLETFTTTKFNEFYAVYAKDGTIRNKLTGQCSSNRCEKFYGGVVVTSDTLYLVRSTDALVNVTPGSCDLGTSHLLSYDVNSLNNTVDISSIGGNALAASSGPLYGDGGALYFATVSGRVNRIGTPRAATAGADSAGGTLFNSGTSVNVDSDAGYTLVGWRVVL
ncbi:MAG: hypothetical protein HOV81_13845 [Kofleriaceae bacterium]|nr:hypothetical protein [Kofleriaceae bacterium]